MLIASGIAVWFAFQSFVNMGMTIGIMPITGLPLPFVSYGGSAIFADMIAVGLLNSVRRHHSALHLTPNLLTTPPAPRSIETKSLAPLRGSCRAQVTTPRPQGPRNTQAPTNAPDHPIHSSRNAQRAKCAFRPARVNPKAHLAHC
jgi:hypothetical protein